MRGPVRYPASLLLVAGGTGGHILPAVAFGDWVRREREGVAVSYMSGARPVELEIYRACGIEPFVIKAAGSPIGAPFAKKISRWSDILISVFQAWRYIRRRSHDLCVLFGGYVSAPALLVCLMKGIRAVFHEQNAQAGKVTSLAARLGVPVASGWDECAPLRRGAYERVGVPIRRFRDIGRGEALRILGVEESQIEGPIVSVMTGSLGSGRLTETLDAISEMETFAKWRFIVVNPGVTSPSEAGRNMMHVPRMWDISPLYAVSDMVITRAGGSTLSEVEALSIPAVIVPWRKSADGHQMKNARQLMGSPIIRVWDESSESLGDLADMLNDLYIIHLMEANHTAKRLYNASKSREKTCGALWDLAIDSGKGEIDFEGRRLH
jgi:UDP-N-acetylglucosamine--N-acetylmuramyl-(pentapeptide) pyrophosphoryl-undecaprenol N-acetylglucosamine transferase